MLPGVNAEQRNELANDRVLVLKEMLVPHHNNGIPNSRILTYRVSPDTNLAGGGVLDEPSPSASLDASQSSVHLVLEFAEAAVGRVDSLSQRAGWGVTTTSALGSEVLPEEAVVQVTTTVKVDGRLKSNLGGNVVLSLSLLELLDGGIVAVDIGLVVLRVVELHDLA